MPELNARLERFLATNIGSVEQLEILLLLHRSPETYWAVDAVAQRLGLRADLVSARLRELLPNKLVVEGSSGAYRFKPAQEEDRETVTQLADAYRDQRILIINAIYTSNLQRLRSFADAFKLGKKD